MQRHGYLGSVLLLAAMFSSMGFAAGEKSNTSVLVVPLLKTSPVIDGNDSDAVWADVKPIALSHQMWGGSAKVTTQVKVGRTDRDLCVLFICNEPVPQKLARSLRQRDSQAWSDDCVELFIAPSSIWPEDSYHFVVTALNTQADIANSLYLQWNSRFRSAVRVKEKSWIAEIAIPFADLNLSPILDDHWKFNVARERHAEAPFEYTSWQKTDSFSDPGCMGDIRLNGLAVVPEIQKESAKLIAEKGKEVLAQLQSKLSEYPKTKHLLEAAEVFKTRQTQFEASTNLSERWAMVQELKKTFPARIDQAWLADQKKEYLVTALSPLVKLRLNQLPSRGDNGASSFSLHAARGEGESGQILITAVKPLEKITVTAHSLTGPKGFTITPELLLAAYVPIKKPVLPPSGFGVPGDYPDPLLPVKPFDIRSGTSQGVFFNLWVPAEAPAGEYTGSVTISPQNAKPETIALKLRVYEVNLPRQSFLKTDMLIWNFMPKWYGTNYAGDMLTRSRQLCLKYRCTSPEWLDLKHFITKKTDGTFSANWTEFDQAVQGWLDQGATILRLQDVFVCKKYNLPETPAARAELGMRLKLVEEHLNAKGWLDRFYFYIFDEPTSGDVSKIKTICNFIHKYGPKLQINLVYQEQLKTKAPVELAGYVRPWVPSTDAFDESFRDQRQAAGDEVWVYTCGSPEGPFPNGIDETGAAGRALGWWCWRYKVQGYLYWCMDYWISDPWANPQICMSSNGEGYLLWPDPEKKHDPFPSLRLLCVRDGFEDYDLMYLLQARVNEIRKNSRVYQQNKTLADQAQILLDASAVILSRKVYSRNPDIYERRHQMILEKLEALNLNAR